jgi:hypothetical protein
MPSTAKRLTGRNFYVDPSFEELATNPPTSQMQVICAGAVEPWIDYWGPIVIEKSRITVRDVLYAIYHYFQTPLTVEDMDYAVAQDPQNLIALYSAFRARLQITHNLRDFEARGGLRRVDCLGGCRMFGGLTVTIFRDGDLTSRWKLVLELGPAPET